MLHNDNGINGEQLTCLNAGHTHTQVWDVVFLLLNPVQFFPWRRQHPLKFPAKSILAQIELNKTTSTVPDARGLCLSKFDTAYDVGYTPGGLNFYIFNFYIFNFYIFNFYIFNFYIFNFYIFNFYIFKFYIFNFYIFDFYIFNFYIFNVLELTPSLFFMCRQLLQSACRWRCELDSIS